MNFKKYSLRQPIKNIVLVILLPLMFMVSSFRQVTEVRKDNGSFYATVDGFKFMVLEDQLFRGLLVNKELSRDERIPARTVIATAFNGPSYTITEERSFTESVRFEIAYDPEKSGEPAYYSLSLQFRSNSYYMIKAQSKLTITEFKWENDKKHFKLSADFDCSMRSQGFPDDGVKDVNLRGKMTDIRITVPSWLGTKN